MPAPEHDVLVVGAGPTGIALALTLARAGVRTLAIDREADIYPLPRAAHIDHETVRILQGLGVADRVMASSRPASRYDFLTASGEILLRFDGSDAIGPGGWPGANMIHQPSVESALRDAARAEPNLTLRTGCAWRGFRETADSVESDIDGATVRTRYLVGCDGARSPVREAAGIAFDDLQFDEPWLVIDVIVHDPERLPKVNLQICDPARPTTCVLMGAGRHRWEFMLKPGETPQDVLDDAFIAQLLKPWNVEGAVTLERKVVYRFNAKVARAWRKGAVLLAGDAAHLMPPFAGQGMCSGLRDAWDLGWKLAAVIAGADARLLDTYQSEREPHVRAIIAMAMMMGRTVCITDPAAAAERDAQMLAARAAGAGPGGPLRYPSIETGCILSGSAGAGAYFPQGPARLDDALGAGPWLITRDALDSATLAPHREMLAAWLDAHHADSVLVRPDRHVFGTGDATALQAAWTAWTQGRARTFA